MLFEFFKPINHGARQSKPLGSLHLTLVDPSELFHGNTSMVHLSMDIRKALYVIVGFSKGRFFRAPFDSLEHADQHYLIKQFSKAIFCDMSQIRISFVSNPPHFVARHCFWNILNLLENTHVSIICLSPLKLGHYSGRTGG